MPLNLSTRGSYPTRYFWCCRVHCYPNQAGWTYKHRSELFYYTILILLWNGKLTYLVTIVYYFSAWHWNWSNDWFLYHGESGYAHSTVLVIYIKTNQVRNTHTGDSILLNYVNEESIMKIMIPVGYFCRKLINIKLKTISFYYYEVDFKPNDPIVDGLIRSTNIC